MNSCLLFGKVFSSSRACSSCGEAVGGAGGRAAHARTSAARPSLLAKSRVHARCGVDNHGALAVVEELSSDTGPVVEYQREQLSKLAVRLA